MKAKQHLPIILSASRATDVPAYYGKWLMQKLHEGVMDWKNPFNGKISQIGLSYARVIVFWTKNPEPFFDYLSQLESRIPNFYFHFTLNDYGKENFEPHIPNLQRRIASFIQLANLVGKEKVIWRYDPIIINKDISLDDTLKRIENIGNQVTKYTNKLVFSFAEIENYTKVKRNLAKHGIIWRNASLNEKMEFLQKLKRLTNKWNIELKACAQPEDYSKIGILPNKCVDDELMRKLFPYDSVLMDYLTHATKDKGQRKHCHCIKSKDIGMYNSCPHFCVYCYANNSEELVEKNYRNIMDSVKE